MTFDGVEGYRAARREIGLGAGRDGRVDRRSGNSARRPSTKCYAIISPKSATFGGRFSRHAGDALPARSTGDRISRSLSRKPSRPRARCSSPACCGNCCVQRVPIRNLRAILEAIVRVPAGERTIDRMVREARIQLGRQFARAYADLGHGPSTRRAGPGMGSRNSKRRSEAASTASRSACCPLKPCGAQQIFTARPVRARLASIVTNAVLRPHLARLLRDFGFSARGAGDRRDCSDALSCPDGRDTWCRITRTIMRSPEIGATLCPRPPCCAAGWSKRVA